MTTPTQQRVVRVLERMAAMSAADFDDAEMFAGELEGMLDSIAGQDGFGTEQQNDPRGDFRDGTWRMGRVQGIDG